MESVRDDFVNGLLGCELKGLAEARPFRIAARTLPQRGQMKPPGQRRSTKNAALQASEVILGIA